MVSTSLTAQVHQLSMRIGSACLMLGVLSALGLLFGAAWRHWDLQWRQPSW